MESLFGGSKARVLDQVFISGNAEQTVSLLVEATGLDYKSVKAAVEKFVAVGLMKKTRKYSNTQVYAFDLKKLRLLCAWASGEKWWL
jgi:hypothetical protein